MRGSVRGDGRKPVPYRDAIDEVSRFGVLAELNGAPVACVFLYFQSSTHYGAVYGAICDINKSSQECRQGITHAAHAVVEYYRSIGIEEIVCYVRTPAVVECFEKAGCRHDDLEYNHVYIRDEVILWLEP